MVNDPTLLPPVDRDVMAVAVEIARTAGALTLEHFRSPELQVDAKDDGTPVTIADRAAERLMREHLAEAFPDDSVIGEEEDAHHGRSQRTWIIDPIDGTKAFTHGVPLYSNLLSLHDEHGPAVGVINLPALGETVWAGRGLGCFCNDDPVRVSTTTHLADSWLMTSGLSNWSVELLGAVQAAGIHVRTWGDGYGYAMVATGRADAMVDPEVARWDIAPMPVVLSEAGGTFSSTQGRAGVDPGSGLASNGLLHPALVELLLEVGVGT